ncbi:DUF4760 domain-containing protein [Advenella sp. WQ 585]|uniref:DUF4760 domain-containing protein n=1 Tax=Advenella mandrilli TaxID=2800330 RepID=A0ABS1EAP3_9BURK|nr:DUF4760 domain-containing protein [Advenella mandrilli]MBK1780591.1 DUF4760 domain-containing protein [Advenella mandrilli]
MDPSVVNSDLILGETYGFWTQTGAIVISAIIAFFMWRHQATQARRRATIDVILDERNNDKLNKAKARIYEILDIPNYNFMDGYNNDESEDKKLILMVLNQKEFIAKGIRCKAFEEEIYKDTQYSNNMKIWRATKPLIMEIRRKTGRETLFQEFEWLARRWEKKPLKKIH